MRSGLGVALMATASATPEGLTVRRDLPVVPPAAMSLRTRSGADPRLAHAVQERLRPILASA